MTLDYSLLATIHRILKQKTDLTERLEKGPRQIKVAENAEKQFENALVEVRESRKQAKMSADQKQLQMGSREAKIEELKAKLNTADSNREFQLLKDQIAADEQANSVLADEIFEMLERIDKLDVDVKEAEANLEKAKGETEKVRKKVNAELAALNEQLDSVLVELKQNEDQLKGEVGAEYRRLVESRGEDTFAETDLTTCGLCFTKITTQTMSELMMKKTVFCKSCGAIMYFNESRVTTSD